jgi:hypothetical protein
MIRTTAFTLLLLAGFGSLQAAEPAAPIDRRAVVARHEVVYTAPEPKNFLQVGNGEFAFAADISGLQTFYPANTMSHWGWHSFPLPPGTSPEQFRLENWDTFGRPIGYATSQQGQDALYNWLRENPHRLNLGRIALQFSRSDGKPVEVGDLQEIRQTLDLWTGTIASRYRIEGQPVQVETSCHPTRNIISARIESPLIALQRLAVAISFPYGSGGETGADWTRPDAHRTIMTASGANRADFARTLDADAYGVSLSWTGTAALKQHGSHAFSLVPGKDSGALEFACEFSPKQEIANPLNFAEVKKACAEHWPRFWKSGAAIDLSESKDPRWRELERRVVLSQYLMAIQEAGSLPPQESGLFNNGWNGKFHLEMHWWHGVQFALWDRWPLFERSLGWYQKTLPTAKKLAQSQGYRGARWPKMVGPEGRDSPSGIGPLLIWQQPHPIYYAELDYRLHSSPGTQPLTADGTSADISARSLRDILDKWRDVVFDTADFLASFAVLDKTSGRYVLGPPIKTVPENTDARTAHNPAFELSYWRFGLRVAQQWRERLGMARDPNWDKVLQNLAPLPVQDGLYLQEEGMTDTYTRWNWEHPSLIGPLGMLPGDGVDPVAMRATVRKVVDSWQWERKSWGWDFPMVAMAAARNGEPRLAVEALLNPASKNRFTTNGLSEGGPFPYFPSNGALLAAVAMMAAGWDGAAQSKAPGFPDDGQWVVRWEGLRPLP